MDCPAAVGRVFNIGSDQPYSIKQLAEEVTQKVNPEVPIEFLPYHEAYGEDFEDVRRRVPDLTRLVKTIGTKPNMSLGEILDDIISWNLNRRQS